MSNPNSPDNKVHQPEIHSTTVIREESSASGGLLWGIVLASLVGLGTVAIVVMNQRPTPQAPSKTTIIEKTKTNVEKVVPQTKAPDVNITMPNPAPAQAPAVNVTVPSPQAAPAQTTPPSKP